MYKIRHLPTKASGAAGLLWQLVRGGRHLFTSLLLSALLAPHAGADSCPDLQEYYAKTASASADWPHLARELGLLVPRCLQSAGFFALYGAAQLNSDQVSAALESLERALLMDPQSGAAQIDYAEALFRHGQIFSALEMNAQVLAREDVPPPLMQALRQREQQWLGLTRQRGLQADALFGRNSNLNRGLDTSRLTLTLSGEPVEFVLSPDYQAISGQFANLRLSGFYTRYEPGHSHNVIADLRTRISADRESDLTQIDARYVLASHGRNHSRLYTAALSNLQMNGEALFTGSEIGLRHVAVVERRCAPYSSVAGQHQYFHRQGGDLDALEARIAGGVDCGNSSPASAGAGVDGQRLLAEVALIGNFALDSNRPGGDRAGWQLRVDWERALYRGAMSVQLAHTRLYDHKGYSELLVGGARRDQQRSYALLQYRQPLRHDLSLLLNIFHQRQRSNIVLFSGSDTSFEAGLSLRF